MRDKVFFGLESLPMQRDNLVICSLVKKKSWLDSIPLFKQIFELLHFVLFIYFEILHAACSFRVSDKITLSCSSDLCLRKIKLFDRLHKLVSLKQSSVLHTATLLILEYYLLLYAIILLLHPIHTRKTHLKHQ